MAISWLTQHGPTAKLTHQHGLSTEQPLFRPPGAFGGCREVCVCVCERERERERERETVCILGLNMFAITWSLIN